MLANEFYVLTKLCSPVPDGISRQTILVLLGIKWPIKTVKLNNEAILECEIHSGVDINNNTLMLQNMLSKYFLTRN